MLVSSLDRIELDGFQGRTENAPSGRVRFGQNVHLLFHFNSLDCDLWRNETSWRLREAMKV